MIAQLRGGVIQQVGVSFSAVNEILNEESVEPFKFTRVQQFKIDDQSIRTCAKIFLRTIETISNLVFRDEASFHLREIVCWTDFSEFL